MSSRREERRQAVADALGSVYASGGRPSPDALRVARLWELGLLPGRAYAPAVKTLHSARRLGWAARHPRWAAVEYPRVWWMRLRPRRLRLAMALSSDARHAVQGNAVRIDPWTRERLPTERSSYLGTEYAVDPTDCSRCGVDTTRECAGRVEHDNALTVLLEGGYGWFVDEQDGLLSIHLCHECAHGFARYIGWDALVHHAHTTEYWEAHPEHDGWDKGLGDPPWPRRQPQHPRPAELEPEVRA